MTSPRIRRTRREADDRRGLSMTPVATEPLPPGGRTGKFEFSLRARWSLILGGLLTAVLAAGALALYWSERTALLREAGETRSALVRQFAQTCGDALVVEDDLALLNGAAMLRRVPGVLRAYCRDAGGRVVGEDAAAPSEGGADVWRVREPVPGRGPGAEAVVDFSRDAAARQIHRALGKAARRIGGVSLAALSVGMGGAFFLAGRLVRPIRTIGRATQLIADGELFHRLKFTRRDELGRLAADFDRMAERLGELDRMKEDFISNVTHELRSPLSAIQSYANLMTDDLRAGRSDSTLDHLTVVRNNAARLTKFINDILDLSKIEAGPEAAAASPLDVGRVVKEVEELFRAKAKEKGITLSLDPIDDRLRGLMGEGAFHQILANLVSNALKFTEAGGRIDVSAVGGVTAGEDPLLGPAAGRRRLVRVTVSDTGRGIAPQDVNRIFDRFEQVKEAREEVRGLKGTGLGLAISRGLAESAGGRLLVRSTPGRGSAFSLYIPEAS